MRRYSFHANQAMSNELRKEFKEFGHPHQGRKECERRMRQSQGTQISKPRRMWHVISRRLGLLAVYSVRPHIYDNHDIYAELK